MCKGEGGKGAVGENEDGVKVCGRERFEGVPGRVRRWGLECGTEERLSMGTGVALEH